MNVGIGLCANSEAVQFIPALRDLVFGMLEAGGSLQRLISPSTEHQVQMTLWVSISCFCSGP